MKNLAEAIKEYQKINLSNKQVISNLNSALIRYTLPQLGFIIPRRSQKRLHPQDLKLALEFSKSISIKTKLGNELLDAQNKELNQTNLSLTNKRQQKKNLTKFVDFLSKSIDRNNKKDNNKKEKEPKKKLREKVVDRTFIEKNRPRKNNKKKITLSFNSSIYPGCVETNQKILNKLEIELKDFENFLDFAGCTQQTKEMYIRQIKILLGWKYNEEKSLQNLSLISLIKPFNINPKIKQYHSINEYYIAKGTIIDSAKEEAKLLINFLNNFFQKYKVNSKSAKHNYVSALISLSKFIYKDITDTNDYENYNDIPIIRRLRIYLNKAKKDNKKIKSNLPEWDIIIQSLKELKRRTDIKNSTNPKEFFNFQRFLILGFFTLIPPSRSRVIRELRIGETLKHGLFKEGIFIPKERLDLREKPKYYIHLQPENYKTGKVYGEWLGEFPNVKFEDGTNFYQYLDRWIYGGIRNLALKNHNHNWLFVGHYTGKILSVTSMRSKIKNIFNSTIGEQISPQKLRTIFRTYLVNKGASQQELESAAFWMRHSNDIAKKVYTQQTLEQKLSPGRAIAEKLNSEILNSSK